MNVTPENFKIDPVFETATVDFYSFRPEPGLRRVLARARFGNGQYVELTCLEWSPSKTRVKVDFSTDGRTSHGIWIDPSSSLELLERLPDVESGNNQTGQASGVEATGGVVAYSHGKLILSLPPAFCEEIEALLENWRKEQFAKIEPGRTFSVIPPEA